jgi:hypothetical protein
MEHFQKIELRKTRDFGEKFNATFEFIRQNYKGFMPAVLFISVPLVLIGMFIVTYYTYFIFLEEAGSLGEASGPLAAFSLMSRFFGLALIAYLFIGVGYLVNTSLVYNYIRLYPERENPTSITVGELWNVAKKDIGNIFVAGLLAVIVSGIGFIFLFLPGVYLGVTLALITSVVVFERKSVGDAFSRCFYLIKDKWWSTFGLIFVAIILQSVMGMIFNIPQYIMTFVITLNSASSDFTAGLPLWQKLILLLTTSISVIGSSMLYCISFIAIAFQYFNLVERREATGLMNQIEGFGSAPTTPQQDPKESY